MTKIRDFLISNSDIFIFFILLFVKIVIYCNLLGGNQYFYVNLFPPIAASLLILIAFSYLLKHKARSRFLYGWNIFISLFIIADVIYFSYFKDIISISIMKMATSLGNVGSSVSDLFKPIYLLFLLDILIIPFIHYFKNKYSKDLGLKTKLITFLIFIVIGVLIEIPSFQKLSVDQPRLLTTMYNRVYITKRLGILNSHGVDLYNYLVTVIEKTTPISATKKTEISQFLNSNSKAQGTLLKSAYKGKNLIVIQVEALQQFPINLIVNGQEVTPNLNRWIKKSDYFDNFYYQIAAGSTSDAEFMVNNSLYPAASGAAYYLYTDNEYNSLAKELKLQNYSTNALHGYLQTFWNRNIMYKAEGFDKFYSDKNYKIDETVGLGISDKSFLKQSVDKIKALTNPFYSFVITLSSHFPFDDVKHYGDFNVGDFEGTFTGNYLKAIHYTDIQLGQFLDTLDKEGILDNSVVVLYGDHYAIPIEHQQELAKLLNINDMNELKWMELQKVPMLIHYPGNANIGVNHIYSGQMDVFPTIANLLALPNNDLMGKDLLNTKDSNVIFRNSSFTDGNIFYLSTTDSYYDIKTGLKISESAALKAKKLNVLNQLGYSDDILQHDLIRTFNKVTKK